MPNSTAPLLYAPADAARLLGLSRAKFYELLDDGAVPSVKIGRARRISRAALEDYVARLEGAR